MGPLFPVSAELAETLPPADFLPLGQVSVPLSKYDLLAKQTPPDPGTGLFCTVKWKPGHGLTFLCLLDGKDGDKPMKDHC